MNKVIAIMMMMSITFAMPAMAGNKPHHNNDKKVVVVNNDKKGSHFDKVDKKTTVSTSRPTVTTSRSSHFDTHWRYLANQAQRLSPVGEW